MRKNNSEQLKYVKRIHTINVLNISVLNIEPFVFTQQQMTPIGERNMKNICNL